MSSETPEPTDSSIDEKAATERNHRLPPSPLREYTFGEIEVTARHAVYRDGDPRRLYLFDARDVTLGAVDLRPPHEYDDDEAWSQLGAWCHYGLDPPIIVYFLSNMARSAIGDAYHDGLTADLELGNMHLPSFAACQLVLELHELSHWAAPDADNPPSDDTGHWESWNSVLQDVVEYVWPNSLSWTAPEWTVEDLPNGVRTPLGTWVESAPDQREHEQTTLDI